MIVGYYIFFSFVPEIVLTGSCLLEYSVAWCILGACRFSWNWQIFRTLFIYQL